jgi:hypothetical protein
MIRTQGLRLFLINAFDVIFLCFKRNFTAICAILSLFRVD